MTTILRLAIQKSGRLSAQSIELLRECGIGIRDSQSVLKVHANNFPLEVYYLRDDDIPQYVADGVADIGIVGKNVVVEKNVAVDTVAGLGFAHCRLSIAIDKQSSYTSVQDLAGKSIATSYPNLLEAFLAEQGVSARIHKISGSVEIAPGIGLSDAVCDLVSSGSTLLLNGLKEVETIFESEAVLVAQKNLPTAQSTLMEKLLFRIRSVNQASATKYIVLNAPNEALDTIAALLPGVKSPSVLPLVKEGWSSMHSLVAESDFWEVIDTLREAGAEGILVLPVEKLIAE